VGTRNWLQRYRDGEREQVWWELRQLGAAVRSPEVINEARAVCDEMAVRARFNVEVIIDRLTSQGFRFHSNDGERTLVEAFRPADSRVADLIDTLESRWGPIPLVVSSWMRLVGDVWLVGTHPDWVQSNKADPLVMELEGSRYPDNPMLGYWASEYEAWEDISQHDPHLGGFVMPVSPDRLHKANVSGGAPYGFRLPDGCADGMFIADRATPFVAYLNAVFEHGGFPGRPGGEHQASIKRSLAEGLRRL
jgi:hypothetical protein